MENERLYMVVYDISNPKRWRRIFKIMNEYGEWIQLSVFQCRLSKRKRVEFEAKIRSTIKHDKDHVIIVDLGLADKADVAVESIGKSFKSIKREAVVI